jgi:hypothetical protein
MRCQVGPEGRSSRDERRRRLKGGRGVETEGGERRERKTMRSHAYRAICQPLI